MVQRRAGRIRYVVVVEAPWAGGRRAEAAGHVGGEEGAGGAGASYAAVRAVVDGVRAAIGEA